MIEATPKEIKKGETTNGKKRWRGEKLPSPFYSLLSFVLLCVLFFLFRAVVREMEKGDQGIERTPVMPRAEEERTERGGEAGSHSENTVFASRAKGSQTRRKTKGGDSNCNRCSEAKGDI